VSWLDFILCLSDYKKLQKVAGVGRQTIFYWKTQQTTPTKKRQELIKKYYGVSIIF